MKLEDTFDFLTADDIRIKGTRVGIESVLYEYVFREQTPEAIAERFPSLTLEQVYAAILYYLHNREEMDRYLREWLAWGRQMREEQDRTPPPVITKLRKARTTQAIIEL